MKIKIKVFLGGGGGIRFVPTKLEGVAARREMASSGLVHKGCAAFSGVAGREKEKKRKRKGKREKQLGN